MDITFRKYDGNKQKTYVVSLDEYKVNSMTPDELANTLISQINSDSTLREVVVAKKVNKPRKILKLKLN